LLGDKSEVTKAAGRNWTLEVDAYSMGTERLSLGALLYEKENSKIKFTNWIFKYLASLSIQIKFYIKRNISEISNHNIGSEIKYFTSFSKRYLQK
jgi:hypothetical protein